MGLFGAKMKYIFFVSKNEIQDSIEQKQNIIFLEQKRNIDFESKKKIQLSFGAKTKYRNFFSKNEIQNPLEQIQNIEIHRAKPQ